MGTRELKLSSILSSTPTNRMELYGLGRLVSNYWRHLSFKPRPHQLHKSAIYARGPVICLTPTAESGHHCIDRERRLALFPIVEACSSLGLVGEGFDPAFLSKSCALGRYNVSLHRRAVFIKPTPGEVISCHVVCYVVSHVMKADSPMPCKAFCKLPLPALLTHDYPLLPLRKASINCWGRLSRPHRPRRPRPPTSPPS